MSRFYFATAVVHNELSASDRSDRADEHRLRQSWRDPSRSSDSTQIHFRVDAVLSPEVLRTLPPDDTERPDCCLPAFASP